MVTRLARAPIGVPLFLAAACLGFVGEAIGGRVVYGIALVAIVVLAARDWSRLRASDRSPTDIADRLAMHMALFAFILAMPGLEILLGLLHRP
jgi:hypothetical protein